MQTVAWIGHTHYTTYTNSLKQFLFNKQQLSKYVIFIYNFEIKINKNY